MKTRFIFAALALIAMPAIAKNDEKDDKKKTPNQTMEAEDAPSVGVTSMSGKEAFLQTIEDLRTGVGIAHAESLSMGGGGGYPVALDKQANGACTACFTDALGDPVADPRWVKIGNTYTFTDGGFSNSFTYDPAAGKIEVK